MLVELNDNKTTEKIDRAEMMFNKAIANSGMSLDSVMVSAAVENSRAVSPTAAEINNRINAGLPFLITTNLTQQQLLNPQNISERQVYSRILECCYPICIKGQDLRKLNMVKNFDETKKLLNL